MGKRGTLAGYHLMSFIIAIIVASVVFTHMIKEARSSGVQGKYVTKDVEDRISAMLQLVEVFGLTTDYENVSRYKFKVKLAAGSCAINLSELYLRFYNGINEEFFFNVTGNCTDYGRGFGIEYEQTSYDYEYGLLSKGDLMNICFTSNTTASYRDEVNMIIVIKDGKTMEYEFKFPNNFEYQLLPIFP